MEFLRKFFTCEDEMIVGLCAFKKKGAQKICFTPKLKAQKEFVTNFEKNIFLL